MRGNNVMLGSYKNPEATAEAFRGGWFHSGDLAVRHPGGYIELRDRRVEKTLYEHPAVLEAAVVALPDEKWGEVPKAYVALRPGQEATAEALIAFCRERLAHFKCPKAVEFGTLAKTSTGKIRKNVLREQARREAAD